MTQTFYITGTRRGLGKLLSEKYGNCNSLEECDVFINCKHDGFLQVELLYRAAELNKRIINIGSASSDWTKGYKDTFKYGIEKKTLRDVNDQLFWQGVNTTILNLGFFNSERVKDVDRPKMEIEYVADLVDWVLKQPHRVKELTVCPSL
jgi:hypothetical protein